MLTTKEEKHLQIIFKISRFTKVKVTKKKLYLV